MKHTLAYILAAVLTLSAAGAPLRAFGQETPATPQAGSLYSEAQLDQLLAPVALYPDALLSQVLMAATYPLEVVEAARWVKDPHNAQLKGDALNAALGDEDWAPAVKSLVPFPQVLEMMDSHLGWMERLGNAFLAQEGDVMNTVQRLRSRAVGAGTLKTSEEQAVKREGQTVVIEPTNPEVIYVPVYDPFIVFGVWPYPAFPPYYFPPPPGYIVEPTLITGFYFSAGFVTINWLWGWSYFDWPRHRVHIDVHRFNVINAHRPPIRRDIWIHDHFHRRGVPYPTPNLRSRFAPLRPGVPERRRDFRGFEEHPRGIPPGAPPRTTPAPRREPHPAPPSRPPHTGAPSPLRPPAGRPLPPAFQDFSGGAGVHRDAERGRTSRRDMSPLRPAPSREGAPSRQGRTPGRGEAPGGRSGGERRPRGGR